MAFIVYTSHYEKGNDVGGTGSEGYGTILGKANLIKQYRIGVKIDIDIVRRDACPFDKRLFLL